MCSDQEVVSACLINCEEIWKVVEQSLVGVMVNQSGAQHVLGVRVCKEPLTQRTQNHD